LGFVGFVSLALAQGRSDLIKSGWSSFYDSRQQKDQRCARDVALGIELVYLSFNIDKGLIRDAFEEVANECILIVDLE
jgi:hypothetical protein